jgi:hypothetical protein
MKKYALISSALAIAATSNCMEEKTLIAITSPDRQKSITIVLKTHNVRNQNLYTKIFPSTQPTAKVQEKISSEPEIVFSLNDEEVQKLRTALMQKNQVQSYKTEFFNSLYNDQTPKTIKLSMIQHIIELESQDNDLDKVLNIHLTPKDQQLIDSLDNNVKQITSKINMPDLQISSLNESIIHTTSVIDQLKSLCRNTKAIQKFTENELIKNESDELFIHIKEKCQNHIGYLIMTINNLTAAISELTTILQTHSNK